MEAENDDRIRLYLAHHDEDLVAATTWVRVWRAHVVLLRRLDRRCSGAGRGVLGISRHPVADDARDAIAAGADVYDLRGITDPSRRTTRSAG